MVPLSLATSFGAEETNGGAAFVIAEARGTAAAPAAVQLGDALGTSSVTATARPASATSLQAVWPSFAAENWTNTAQGPARGVHHDAAGLDRGAGALVILPAGTSASARSTTPDDHRQAAGLRRHPGRHDRHQRLPQELRRHRIVGTCASDRRFKKDITPFGQCSISHRAAAGALLLARGGLSRAALRRRSRLRPDRAGRRAGPARARGHQRRRLQGGRLQQAAAAHHPGRQGPEGGERRT